MSGRAIARIYLSSGRRDKISDIAREALARHVPFTFVDASFFDKRFPKGHQGVAARVLPKQTWSLEEVLTIPSKKEEVPFFLVLDCIEDPRNLGAIVRVAEAAGVHGVILQSRRSALPGAEAAKTSAGALEYVPIAVVPNVKHALYALREEAVTIVGTDANAPGLLWETDLTHPLALVVGSEGEGLRKTVRDLCDVVLRIPMIGRVNSLNVSAATSIFAFEVLRQRMIKKEQFEEK